MRIGLDLDNTIICYDTSFHRAALEMGLLSATVGAAKGEVKAWVQGRHGNDVWTELQGEVYGPRLQAAVPYEGALEFARQCRGAGHSVCIVSHKTQFAARGGRVDLREAALEWLCRHGWFAAGGVEHADVEFLDTRAEKVAAIERRGCEIFIDDLPEVFQESGFPTATTRFLFDPEGAFPEAKGCLRFGSWAQMAQAVFFSGAEIRVGEGPAREVGPLVAKLLAAAGLPSARAMQPLQGGRNNKVWRISAPASDLLFKSYFHSPLDTRDRLGREFDFLRHLGRTGCTFAPRPLTALPEEHVGLMEFIEGVRPSPTEVDENHIDQAIAFFFEANRDLDHPLTLKIEPASEACFTVAEHLERTQKRVDRLGQMVREDEVDEEAIAFAHEELKPVWREVRVNIEAEWPSEEARQTLLPQAERCLSPSDFGFHNSIQRENGKLCFLDFEYAGWDDPAKLIADFANQPDLLLDRTLSDRFREAVIAANRHPAELARRVAAREPLYQIKWACICLNDFLEFGRTRLQFTDGPGIDRKARRKFQLARARQMLERARMR
jgi:hypothetical protein